MAGTILKLGYSSPLTDAFGAHPQLGAVLDLNDGATFTLTFPDGLQMPAPPKTLVTAGNIRTQGERATRAIYRHNREVRCGLILGPMLNASNLTAAIRLLLSWLNSPPSVPFTIQYQPPSATSPVYLDVVGAAHDISEDETDWLRFELEPVEIVFVCRPGMRGDRVWLQNLIANPGFEAPSGPGIEVFNDSFANGNAYALISGSAPGVASNVLTLPASTIVSFGSPAWGAIQQWVLRFQMPTGGSAFNAYLHRVDASNYLRCVIQATLLRIQHTVAGPVTTIATSSALALTAGTFYWLVVTQFPTVPGDPAYVTAELHNDSAGALGTLIAGSNVAAPTVEVSSIGAIAGLSGVMALENTSAAGIGIGGAFANVHTVSLFGPGGWLFAGGVGANGTASGAWEGSGIGVASQGQSIANTFPSGPVQSYGAARIDAAPAGTLDAQWLTFNGTSPNGTAAIPATQGEQISVSAWAKAPGIGASATLRLLVSEWTAAGAFLSNTAVVTLTGPQAAWTQLSGTYTVQNATAAFVGISVRATDSSSASAGATIWWDSIQCWQTPKSASMPYCELRFLQSPARLVVSGLLGDLPAPALLAFGTYLSSWPTGSILTFAIGRRGQESATARLVAPSNGYYGAALSPQSIAALDSSSYGGYYAQATVTNAGWNPRAFSESPADAPGIYHLITRFLTQQILANLGNVEVRVSSQQRLAAWFGQAGSVDQVGNTFGPFTEPMTASNAWQVVDAGQFNIPPLPSGALADPSQTQLTPRPQWGDLSGGGSICQSGWQALLPIDGSLIMGLINNPSNAPFAVTQQWLWAYFDGLGMPTNQPVAWTTSVESAPSPNPAHAGGGPGTSASGAINVNSGADPYLTLDPTLEISGAGGVNELVGYIADGNAAVLPFYGEIAYSPLYLYPR